MQKLSQYWNRLNLGIKLTAVTTVLIIIMAVVGTIVTVRREQQTLREELAAQAELLLKVFVVTGGDLLYRLDTNALGDLLEPLGEDQGILSQGRFYDSNGRIISDAFSKQVTFSIGADPYGQRLLASQGVVFDWQADQLIAGRAIRVGSQVLGAVSVGLPTVELNAKVATVRNQGIGLAIVAILLGVGVSIYFGRSVTGPLQKLTQATEQIATGDLSQYITIDSGGEFAVLANGFNAMVAQLQETINSLEDRSRILAANNRIAQSLSTSLNQEELLAIVVDQIQSAFSYYQVQIYQLASDGKELVIMAGTGSAGSDLVSKRYSVALEATSLVAQAAKNKQLMQYEDVRQQEGWLPNPLLPNTLSEIAVPIIIEDEVIGVLDIQEDSVGGLGEIDQALLQALASQLSSSIRNARQFTQLQIALEEAQALQTRYVEQAWDIKRIAARHQHQVFYNQKEDEALNEAAIAEARRQLKANQALTILPANGQDSQEPGGSLVAPLQLHETQIGNLQLYKDDPNDRWTDSELVIINAVIDQVTQVAENLRLLEQTQERASQERLIGQITDKIRRAPDMQSLMETGVAELNRALNPNRAFVRFGNAETLTGGKIQTQKQASEEPDSEISDSAMSLSEGEMS